MRTKVASLTLVLAVTAVAARTQAPSDREVVEWLQSRAIPLQSVVAGSGFDDLQPLKRIWKDVRVVGLGEATHGTREFSQLKHRILEFLVREMGFRIFAIEASYAASFNVNDYIMGRTSNGAAALASLTVWVWDTEEVRAMLDWMRAYNADVTAAERVKFVGFDFALNEVGKEKILEYLTRLAPSSLPEIEALFDIDEMSVYLAARFARGEQERADGFTALLELRDRYLKLLGLLAFNETRFTQLTSSAEFEQAREYAHVLVQFLYAYARPRTGLSRDEYMAENIRRILDVEGPEARVVLWAHNGHVSTRPMGGRSMGDHLRRLLGERYYALGLTFNRGSFQARDAAIEQSPSNPTNRVLRAFTVGPAQDGSIEWYFARTGIKNFMVDLRSGANSDVVTTWLEAPHRMRSIGAVFSSGGRGMGSPRSLSQYIDGLVFFDSTTPARPNPSVQNVAQ